MEPNDERQRIETSSWKLGKNESLQKRNSVHIGLGGSKHPCTATHGLVWSTEGSV